MRHIILTLTLFLAIQQGFAQKLSVQTGHSDAVNAVQFSPDGKYLVSAGNDNNLILWDVKSTKQFVIMSGHTAPVNEISFHPSKNIIASASDDKTVRLWEYPSGKLLHTYSFFSHPAKAVSFGKSGDKLACGSDFVYLINTQSNGYEIIGKKARFLYTAVALGPKSETLAYGGIHESKVKLLQLNAPNSEQVYTLKVNQLKFSDKGEYLYAAGKNGKISRYEVQKQGLFKSNYRITVGRKQDAFMSIDMNNDFFVGANKNQLIYVYTQKGGKLKNILKGHFDDVSAISISPDGKYLASTGKDRFIILWNLEKGRLIKVLSGTGIRINSIAFSDDGTSMAMGYSNGVFRMWNLASQSRIITNRAPQKNFYKGSNEWSYSAVGFNDNFNGDHLYVRANLNKTGIRGEKHPETREDLLIWEHGMLHPDSIANRYKLLKSAATSKYKQYVLSDSMLFAYNFVATHKQRKSLFNNFKFESPEPKVYQVEASKRSLKPDMRSLKKKSIQKWKGDIVHQSISNSGQYAARITYHRNKKNTCTVSEMETGTELWSFSTDSLANYVGFSPNAKWLYIVTQQQQKITVYNRETKKETYVIVGDKPLTYSLENNMFISSNQNGMLYAHNATSGKLLYKIDSEHSGRISDIKFNEPYDYFATASFDGLIKFRDTKTGKLKLSLAAFNDNDFIFINPQNYYFSSQGAMHNIAFTVGKNIYAFEQFDLKFNRPDIVLSDLGYTPPKVLHAYKKAYLKRIKKLGLTEQQITQEIHIPTIELSFPEQLEIETEKRKLRVRYLAEDTKKNIKSINVWLNDVPVFGQKGKNVHAKNTQEISEEVELILSAGNNKIQVSATNQDGAESNKETFNITYTGQVEKPDLYIVAVGVSEYKDASKNLDFAVKDARDIIQVMAKDGVYGKISVDSIFDRNATQENVLRLKDKLMKTKVDDRVVVFFAGHGVLNKNFDYFLATYDTNFENPSSGLAYESLLSLLDGIPSRNKLMLMDACHSGELDKDALALKAKKKKKKGKRKFRDAGEVNVKKLDNTFELMKSLFADIRRGTGAMVISSAGGAEYAQESKEWGNGVFTYSLVNGLKKKAADTDKDGVVSIIELRDYVRENVIQLTNGAQRPSSRTVNLENNFVIWETK